MSRPSTDVHRGHREDVDGDDEDEHNETFYRVHLIGSPINAPRHGAAGLHHNDDDDAMDESNADPFTPASFVSSRWSRARIAPSDARDVMDEFDVVTARLIAVRPEYTSANQTVGMRLLQSMGWIAPTQRVYGAELPPTMIQANAVALTAALYQPPNKQDTAGLGDKQASEQADSVDFDSFVRSCVAHNNVECEDDDIVDDSDSHVAEKSEAREVKVFGWKLSIQDRQSASTARRRVRRDEQRPFPSQHNSSSAASGDAVATASDLLSKFVESSAVDDENEASGVDDDNNALPTRVFVRHHTSIDEWQPTPLLCKRFNISAPQHLTKKTAQSRHAMLPVSQSRRVNRHIPPAVKSTPADTVAATTASTSSTNVAVTSSNSVRGRSSDDAEALAFLSSIGIGASASLPTAPAPFTKAPNIHPSRSNVVRFDEQRRSQSATSQTLPPSYHLPSPIRLQSPPLPLPPPPPLPPRPLQVDSQRTLPLKEVADTPAVIDLISDDEDMSVSPKPLLATQHDSRLSPVIGGVDNSIANLHATLLRAVKRSSRHRRRSPERDVKRHSKRRHRSRSPSRSVRRRKND